MEATTFHPEKLLQSGEHARSICPVHMQQRLPIPDP